MGALFNFFTNFLKVQALNTALGGKRDDGLGDRENRKKLAARAFLEGYEPDPRLFAKGPDDAPNVVVPEPLVEAPAPALPVDAPVAPQLIPATVGGGSSSDYVINELQRIDANVQAIAAAMAQNVETDRRYRQSVLESQKQQLAARGQRRSRRRAERRRGLIGGFRRDVGRSIRRVKGRFREAAMDLGGGLLAYGATKSIATIKENFQFLQTEFNKIVAPLKRLLGMGGEEESVVEPTPESGQPLTPPKSAYQFGYGLPKTNTLPGRQHYGASRNGGARQHAGTDFDPVDDVNSEFFSQIGGTVVKVGRAQGYGNYVDIYNDDLKKTERIAEGDKIVVSEGEKIRPGQLVSRGSTQTGVFHYEIREGEAGGKFGIGGTIDPLDFLQKNVPNPGGNTPPPATIKPAGQLQSFAPVRRPMSQEIASAGPMMFELPPVVIDEREQEPALAGAGVGGSREFVPLEPSAGLSPYGSLFGSNIG